MAAKSRILALGGAALGYHPLKLEEKFLTLMWVGEDGGSYCATRKRYPGLLEKLVREFDQVFPSK